MCLPQFISLNSYSISFQAVCKYFQAWAEPYNWAPSSKAEKRRDVTHLQRCRGLTASFGSELVIVFTPGLASDWPRHSTHDSAGQQQGEVVEMLKDIHDNLQQVQHSSTDSANVIEEGPKMSQVNLSRFFSAV